MEEEEIDQQPPNRTPSPNEALQHVHSLMQFAKTNLPHLQPTLINIYSEILLNLEGHVRHIVLTTIVFHYD